ncbi:MAG TPA: DUF4369 domain-containing protein [Flavobacterium sp.]
MKKYLIALAAIVLTASCSDKKEGNLQLTGNIEGLHKGTVYIQKLEDTAFVVLDSIAINGDSKFESSLNIDSPEMLYLFLDRGTSNNIDNSLMFFAEPGKINIDTDLETLYAKAKVTGSKNHDLYEEYKKVKARFTNEELTLTEQELIAFKDQKQVPADLKAKYGTILRRKYLYAANFALNNRDHEIAPYIALAEISDVQNVMLLDTIQKAMSPKVAKGKYGKILTKYVSDRKKEQVK